MCVDIVELAVQETGKRLANKSTIRPARIQGQLANFLQARRVLIVVCIGKPSVCAFGHAFSHSQPTVDTPSEHARTLYCTQYAFGGPSAPSCGLISSG